MKIIIATISNAKLIESFPTDPYSNITIRCNTTNYNLDLAYLTIDSTYFSTIDQNSKQIDLSQFDEDYLTPVLRALYGDQLIAKSINQLQGFFQVIKFLQIDDFKLNIQNQIIESYQLTKSIEILIFCLRYNVIVEKIRAQHLKNNLQALTIAKNYLHLNKLSEKQINQFLLDYYKEYGQQGQDVINDVIQNYLNRNNISPIKFFLQNSQIRGIMYIWEKHHHKLQIGEMIKKKSIRQRSSTQSMTPTKSCQQQSSEFDSIEQINNSNNLFERIHGVRLKLEVPQSNEYIPSHSRTQSFTGNDKNLQNKNKILSSSERLSKKLEKSENNIIKQQISRQQGNISSDDDQQLRQIEKMISNNSIAEHEDLAQGEQYLIKIHNNK